MNSNLSAYNLFKGALYTTTASYSSLFDILDVFEKGLRQLPYNTNTLEREISKISNHISSAANNQFCSDSEALCLINLFLGDLEKVQSRISLLEDRNPEDDLHNLWSSYKEVLAEHSIKLVDFPDLFFVDKYPDPVSENIWSAASFFHDDEEQYGMKRGIYFRHDALVPFASATLLAHELIHFTMERKGKIIPRRLEEGFCDLVGSCYLGGRRLGFATSFTIVKNSLFNDPSDPLWWLYSSNLLQASFLYKNFGMKGMAHCINKEATDDYLINIETEVLLGRSRLLDLPAGDINSEFTIDLEALTATPIHFVLSPLAFAVIKEIVDGMTLNQISDKYKLSKKDLDLAIADLGTYPLLLVNNGSIVSETASNYLKTNMLRYRVNKDKLSRLIFLRQ